MEDMYKKFAVEVADKAMNLFVQNRPEMLECMFENEELLERLKDEVSEYGYLLVSEDDYTEMQDDIDDMETKIVELENENARLQQLVHKLMPKSSGGCCSHETDKTCCEDKKTETTDPLEMLMGLVNRLAREIK